MRNCWMAEGPGCVVGGGGAWWCFGPPPTGTPSSPAQRAARPSEQPGPASSPAQRAARPSGRAAAHGAARPHTPTGGAQRGS